MSSGYLKIHERRNINKDNFKQYSYSWRISNFDKNKYLDIVLKCLKNICFDFKNITTDEYRQEIAVNFQL